MSRPTRRFRLMARLAIMFVRALRWRITVTGLDHVPRTGGAVVTWNHHGHLDIIGAVWGIYRQLGRQPRILAKQELWRSRWTRWVMQFVQAVPVERAPGTDRTRSLHAAIEALRGGAIVALAPEGTISSSFELLPFRSGAVRMAQEAGVPIVPSAGWGSHRLVTSDHGLSLRRGSRIAVSVAYGEPIHVGPDDDIAEATARLRAATEQLLHELQEHYPDGAPAGAWWVPARLGGGAPVPSVDDPRDPDPTRGTR